MKDTVHEFYQDIEPAQVISIDELNRRQDLKKKDVNTQILSNEDYAQELYNLYTGYELKTPLLTEGTIVKGVVQEMNVDQFTIDVGYKFPIYMMLSKEKNVSEIIEKYNIGDEIEVYITDLIKSGKYTIGAYGSLGKLDTRKTLTSIYDSLEKEDNNQFFEAKIISLIEGGYLVDINGNHAFLPGSLAAPNKIINFKEKLGETVKVAPVQYSGDKKYMVVSHKEYIKRKIPQLIENLNINDTIYEGTVTGTAKFGVFVEFKEYLTGMIHVSELDNETKKAFKSRSLAPGDKVEFRVKEVVNDDRIILSQQEPEEDPWNDFSISIPSVVETRVNGIRNYGLFLEFTEFPGVVGLLHTSEMGEYDLEEFEEGDLVNVRVTKVDPHAQKVFFSMKE